METAVLLPTSAQCWTRCCDLRASAAAEVAEAAAAAGGRPAAALPGARALPLLRPPGVSGRYLGRYLDWPAGRDGPWQRGRAAAALQAAEKEYWRPPWRLPPRHGRRGRDQSPLRSTRQELHTRALAAGQVNTILHTPSNSEPRIPYITTPRTKSESFAEYASRASHRGFGCWPGRFGTKSLFDIPFKLSHLRTRAAHKALAAVRWGLSLQFPHVPAQQGAYMRVCCVSQAQQVGHGLPVCLCVAACV